MDRIDTIIGTAALESNSLLARMFFGVYKNNTELKERSAMGSMHAPSFVRDEAPRNSKASIRNQKALGRVSQQV